MRQVGMTQLDHELVDGAAGSGLEPNPCDDCFEYTAPCHADCGGW